MTRKRPPAADADAGGALLEELTEIRRQFEERGEDFDGLNATLLEIRNQLTAHTELLGVIACATARAMLIANGEHRMTYSARASVKDALGLVARVEQALARFADEEESGEALGQ